MDNIKLPDRLFVKEGVRVEDGTVARYKFGEVTSSDPAIAFGPEYVLGTTVATHIAVVEAERDRVVQELVDKNYTLAASVFRAAVALEDVGQTTLAQELFDLVQPEIKEGRSDG